MSLFLAKKQEDLNQKKVRDLLRLKENKKCFDCPTKSPFFVNTTIQTFICARCSGLVREVGHRVKAISASKFSGAELLALKQGGNGMAIKIWLSNYSTHDAPEPESDDDIRAFMRQKYYENKWLDRALLLSHKEKVRALLAKQFTEDGLPIVTKPRTKLLSGFSRVPLIADSEMNIMKDDDEDEEFGQDQVAPPMPIPDCVNPVTFALPPFASPTGRGSMESEYSSFSAKSSASVQEDYVSSKRRSTTTSSKRNSRVSSARESMDSTGSSTTSSVASSGATVLTAEEIAERCRSSIESKDFIAQEILPSTPEPVIEEPVSVQEEAFPVEEFQAAPLPIHLAPARSIVNADQVKTTPLKVNVAQANREHVPKYQHQQHLKSPTLVNYGNGVQSPAPILRNASASASPVVTPSTSKPLPNSFDSIIMELSGLKLEKTVRRATYNGGMLSPAVTPLSPSSSTSALKTPEETKTAQRMFDPSVFSLPVVEKAAPENDPYAALRGIPAPVVAPVVVMANETKEQSKEADFLQSDEDDDDPWQEFCSSSSVDEDKHIEAPAQVIQPIMENKPAMAMDIFGDLDPLAMFRRF